MSARLSYQQVSADAEQGEATPYVSADVAGRKPAPAWAPAVRLALLALEAGVACVAVYWFMWLFHNPLCGVLFRCGCTWNFNGGWDRCNVHNPTGPHCPWCEAPPHISWTTDYLVEALMLALYGYLRWKARALRWPLRRLVAEVVALEGLLFVCHGLVVGLIFKLATGYPYFLFWGAYDAGAGNATAAAVSQTLGALRHHHHGHR